EKNNFERIQPSIGRFGSEIIKLNKDELMVSSTGYYQKLNIHSLVSTIVKSPVQIDPINLLSKDCNENIYHAVARSDSNYILKYDKKQNLFAVSFFFLNSPGLVGNSRVFYIDR